MDVVKRGAIVFGFLFVVVTAGLILINVPPTGTPTGFAIYQDSCNSVINSSGFWELNATLSCSSGNGVEINSSNIDFQCNSNSILGSLEQDSSGIFLHSGLTNITIQNCNISMFYNPIFVSAETEVSIKNSYAEKNNSCVQGNWTDSGGNTGCLDIIAPSLSLTNQTIYNNQSLSYQINATDLSTISSYTIDDNQTFSITSSTGIISNITNFSIQNYSITITVLDSQDNSASELLGITVLDSNLTSVGSNSSETNQTETNSSQQSESEEESSSEESASSSEIKTSTPVTVSASSQSSSGGGGTGLNCVDAWKCNEWSECENGKQARQCEKTKTACSVSKPISERECTPTEAETQEISDNSTEEVSDEKVALTGGVISRLANINLESSIGAIKNNWLIFVAALVLIVGFTLNIVLGSRVKRRKGVLKALKGKLFKNTEDDKQKLWEWEEKH